MSEVMNVGVMNVGQSKTLPIDQICNYHHMALAHIMGPLGPLCIKEADVRNLDEYVLSIVINAMNAKYLSVSSISKGSLSIYQLGWWEIFVAFL